MARYEEGSPCPACGLLLLGAEKIRYAGKHDLRYDTTVFCPACGWKQRCRDLDTDRFWYHLGH